MQSKSDSLSYSTKIPILIDMRKEESLGSKTYMLLDEIDEIIKIYNKNPSVMVGNTTTSDAKEDIKPLVSLPSPK